MHPIALGHTHVCTTCYSSFEAKRSILAPLVLAIGGIVTALAALAIATGGGLMSLVLLALGLFLGIRGARGLRPATQCPACKGTLTVPLETPAARLIISKRPPA